MAEPVDNQEINGSLESSFTKMNTDKDSVQITKRFQRPRTALQKLYDHPVQSLQNMEAKLLYIMGLIIFVIWVKQQERKRQQKATRRPSLDMFGAARARAESNMSGSMDDASTRSRTKTRSQSQEFLLSPFLMSKRQLSANITFQATHPTMEMFQSLRWTDETQDLGLDLSYRSRPVAPSETPSAQGSDAKSAAGDTRTARSSLAIKTTKQSPQTNAKLQNPSRNESVVRYGPYVTSMVYNTWTPPPSWAEAARRVFPRDVKTLRRALKLDLMHQPPTLTITDGCTAKQSNDRRRASPSGNLADKNDNTKTQEFCMNVTEFSVHPTPPTEGVLEVYVKNTPKSEWMEHTFQSAQAAAQFQTDLIATQLLGPAIQNMYHVFRLIHQGSKAHDGQEFVLHEHKINYSASREHLVAVGVPWDDVMRCFGSSFPRIRAHLEDLWWNGIKPKKNHPKNKPEKAHGTTSNTDSTATDQTETEQTGDDASPSTEDNPEASAEYVSKRILLGPVDFFRLFVPSLPPDALPYTTSDVKRMEQIMRWRKRVARASFLLERYARARQLANNGWVVAGGLPLPDGYRKTRLSYDMNIDNHARDKTAKNEVYEPYVSRDVFCRVRGTNYLQRKWWNCILPSRICGETVMSLGQAFSLVDTHVFSLKGTEAHRMIDVNSDLVLSVPSLRHLVESNPDVEFFVWQILYAQLGSSSVYVYARSLAEGVDPSFDMAWERFKAGDEENRRQKLEFNFQLGLSTFAFPMLYILFLKLLSFLIWTVDPTGYVAQTGNVNSDRYCLPPLKAEAYGHCRHFGGALSTSHRNPTNYASMNVLVDSTRYTSWPGRMMILLLSSNSLKCEISDISLKIRGGDEKDLPERVLLTVRLVNMDFYKVALDQKALMNDISSSSEQIELISTGDDEIPSRVNFFLKFFFIDPLIAGARACARYINKEKGEDEGKDRWSITPANETRLGCKPAVIATNDPIEKAVNHLIELLEDVMIPMKIKQKKTSVMTVKDTWAPPLGTSPLADKALESRRDLKQVPILRVVNRSDLRRYFVASGCSLKKAMVRTVESAAWRGLTFPVDIRSCRIELQTGQFFQQGIDKSGHPIFYFRNMCKGPWRGNEDAVIAAVVHRFEKCLVELAAVNQEVRCTVIVLMGKPKAEKKRKKKGLKKDSAKPAENEAKEDVAQEKNDPDDHGEEEDSPDDDDVVDLDHVDNPRVPHSERYFSHSSERLASRLLQLLMLHYPERLYRAFIVKGHGGENFPGTIVGMKLAISHILNSPNTCRKIKFLHRESELQNYVAKEELIKLGGGEAEIPPLAFHVE